MASNLKIQNKVRYLKIFIRNNVFPKIPKYSKYKYLKDGMMESINTLTRLTCKVKRKYYKLSILEDIDVEIEILREYINECVEDDHIGFNAESAKQWFNLVNEIGAMVGGWIQKEKRGPQYTSKSKKNEVFYDILSDKNNFEEVSKKKVTEEDVFIEPRNPRDPSDLGW